jgi:hypothetical protein
VVTGIAVNISSAGATAAAAAGRIGCGVQLKLKYCCCCCCCCFVVFRAPPFELEVLEGVLMVATGEAEAAAAGSMVQVLHPLD